MSYRFNYCAGPSVMIRERRAEAVIVGEADLIDALNLPIAHISSGMRFGQGDRDAVHGADVALAADLDGPVLHRDGGAHDRVGGLKIRLDGDAQNGAGGWIEIQVPVVAGRSVVGVGFQAGGIGVNTVGDSATGIL